MPIEIFGDSARGEEYAAVRLVVDGSRILEADVPGMSRDVAGLTVLDAAAVPGETLAADALANALAQALQQPEARACREVRPMPGRVAVAMSGGVDSAVALLRARPDAVGVTLRLWSDPQGRSSERVCCSPSAVIAARELCHSLGLPHVTLDLRETFRRVVVDPFVQGYADGSTPNPCSRCNGAFRFAELVTFAELVCADVLWTGHYASLAERDGVRLVARAADSAKDQSYMLATVDPSLLARVGFPLGTDTKEGVRGEARAAGLSAANRPESQEACFLAGDDYRVFLSRQGLADHPGPVVDEEGNELGRHEGLWRYTPGQRRRLGIAASEPLYAVRADRARNALVVGPRGALGVTGVEAQGSLHVHVDRVEAQLRHRSVPTSASVRATPGGFVLSLDAPVEGVAPGQVAALYVDGAVVGAGEIVRTSR